MLKFAVIWNNAKYVLEIVIDGRAYHFGNFDNEKSANAALIDAEVYFKGDGHC